MKKLLLYPILGANARLRMLLNFMQCCQSSGNFRLAKFFAYRIQASTGCFISPKAFIPKSVSFKHATGIVIGDGVKLGENVSIFQHVTLGGARIGDAKANRYPKIGNGTVIFAGAVIVGDIKVGSRCVIGANSVVLSDVPDDCTAVGAPARVIRSRKRT